MGLIKNIIQSIDIQAEDQEIREFIKKHKPAINEFFKEKWTMFKQEQLFDMQLKGKQIKIPNGKEGKEYAADFNLDSIGLSGVNSFELENLPEGISYSKEEGVIAGVPKVAGDHKLILRCVSKQGFKAEKELLFIVVSDPKKIWKNIPTSPDIVYYKPDSDSKFQKGEAQNTDAQKNMIAASQRGRSHAHVGDPRDDDFALYFDAKTAWYIMAVADGAGSAKYARKGSEIACQTALDVCKNQLAEVGGLLEEQIKLYWDKKNEERKDAYEFLHQIVGKAAFESYKEICREAGKACLPKDFATTLILSICKKFDFGWFVGAFWVGDGGIGIYHKEKQELKILGEPDGGEFAGQTRFLTMKEIFSDRVRTRFEIVGDFTALVLMTDGVTDPKFETDANLNKIEKWNDLWNDFNGKNEDNQKVDFNDCNEQTAEQLLKWLDFWSRGNHDDRTIAILY